MNHTSTVGSLHSHYSSGRTRARSRQPVYTSDKRAKFTQRESKKWIRFITVVGYIVFVSMPAVCLSIYYVYIWDPQYLSKFPNEAAVNKSYGVYKSKEPPRNVRDLGIHPPNSAETQQNHEKHQCSCPQITDPIKPMVEPAPSLVHILSTLAPNTGIAPNSIEITHKSPSTMIPTDPNVYLSSSSSSSSEHSSSSSSSSSEYASKSLEVH